jgi:Fe-S oxidoreductase
MLSNIDLLGKIGCKWPRLTNAALGTRPLRKVMEKTLGISAKRPLPPYASERFDHWFAQRSGAGVDQPGSNGEGNERRGRVILWDDTFVRYNEPHIGKAAVKVLEALGFEVALATGRKCCGRPAFSQGNLAEAARLGRHNLDLLGKDETETPILFLEASCYSMFAEDYRELQLSKADEVARRSVLFEKFVNDLLEREAGALRFGESTGHVAIHAHCHAKSLLKPDFMARLAERLPGRTATLLETGCCGMAGAFGALKEKYDLSLKVGALLVDKVKEQPADTVIVASGTSCRHQLEHLTSVTPKHMAELLAEALN